MKNLVALILILNFGFSLGQISIHKKLRLSDNFDFYGTAITNTIDSGFVIAGYQAAYINSIFNNTVTKFDKDGNAIWCKKYPCTGTLVWEVINSVYETTNSGYLVTGQTSQTVSANEAIIHRLDSNGTALWKGVVYTGFPPESYGIKSIEKGSTIYSAGTAYSHQLPSYVSYLIKLDLAGNLIWKKIYAGFSSNVSDLLNTQDGNILIAGNLGPPNSSLTGYLMKVDTSGNILWLKTYSTKIGNVYELSNGDLIFLGQSPRFLLAKVDPTSGNLIWCKRYFNPMSPLLGAPKLAVFNDSKYAITESFGDTVNRGSLIMILDSIGDQISSSSIGQNLQTYRTSQITSPYSDKIAAYTFENATGTDAYSYLAFMDANTSSPGLCNSLPFSISDSSSTLIIDTVSFTLQVPVDIYYRLDSSLTISDTIVDSVLCITNSISENHLSEQDFKIFPNPFGEQLNIEGNDFNNATLIIYDITGRKLIEQCFKKNTQLKVNALNKGSYLLVIHGDNFKNFRRIILKNK